MAGLPVACSRLGPMPKIARDSAIYFEPDALASIAAALRSPATDADLRAQLAHWALALSAQLNWPCTAAPTWSFLQAVADGPWDVPRHRRRAGKL